MRTEHLPLPAGEGRGEGEWPRTPRDEGWRQRPQKRRSTLPHPQSLSRWEREAARQAPLSVGNFRSYSTGNSEEPSSLSDLAPATGSGGAATCLDGWENVLGPTGARIKLAVLQCSTRVPSERSPFLQLRPCLFSSRPPVSGPPPVDAAVSGCRPGIPASTLTTLSPARASGTAGSPAPP